jgi:hypothetical protein
MKIKINRTEETTDVNMLTIVDGEKEFRIHINRLGELVINKMSFNDESSSIVIIPRVSNEIELK